MNYAPIITLVGEGLKALIEEHAPNASPEEKAYIAERAAKVAVAADEIHDAAQAALEHRHKSEE